MHIISGKGNLEISLVMMLFAFLSSRISEHNNSAIDKSSTWITMAYFISRVLHPPLCWPEEIYFVCSAHIFSAEQRRKKKANKLCLFDEKSFLRFRRKTIFFFSARRYSHFHPEPTQSSLQTSPRNSIATSFVCSTVWITRTIAALRLLVSSDVENPFSTFSTSWPIASETHTSQSQRLESVCAIILDFANSHEKIEFMENKIIQTIVGAFSDATFYVMSFVDEFSWTKTLFEEFSSLRLEQFRRHNKYNDRNSKCSERASEQGEFMLHRESMLHILISIWRES